MSSSLISLVFASFLHARQTFLACCCPFPYTMKRNWLRILQDQLEDITELQLWLCRVKTFEAVNRDVEMPDYSTLEALLDLDFEWQWTRNCSREYDAVVLVTSVVNVKQQTTPWSRTIPLTLVERTFVPGTFNCIEPSVFLDPRSTVGVQQPSSATLQSSSTSSANSLERIGHVFEDVCDDLERGLHESGCEMM